jgi:hypothetical protein
MAAKLRDVTTMKPRQLAEELVRLQAEHRPLFDRQEALKSQLRSTATENFKEVFAGIGEVSVSAPKPGETTGTAPELVIASYLELPKKDQKALLKAGTVQIVDAVKSAYHGQVRVKLF